MTAKALHPVQKRLLDLLASNIEDPLTIRELQERLNLSSTSGVAHHLNQLEKYGYLKRNPNNPRDYHVLSDPEKQVTYLNLYGLAHCGPRGSILDDNPIDRIPIAARILDFPSIEAFLVKAKGDSMNPKIKEGDLIIARRNSEPLNDRIMVVINDGEAIIKRIHKEGTTVILASDNPKIAPFLASSNDFRIVGEVRGILSYQG